MRGRLSPSKASEAVSLQVRRKRRWSTVDRARTDGRGAYLLRWRPNGAGARKLRLAYRGDESRMAATRRLGKIHVYRTAQASWYGPGLYGNRLGCGGTLGPNTLGVAHKQLPCGARVTLHYRGQTVRTRVIDRGPYVAGREFDLTAATKRRLGFGSTGRIQFSTG